MSWALQRNAVVVLFAVAGTASSQTNAPRKIPTAPQSYAISGVRLTRDLVIDGRLDDAAWTGVLPVSGFVQQSPEPGQPATQRTEARVLVDGTAIFVAMRMYDTAPDSIVGTLARRDYMGYSDWAHVILDSFHDRRTAFRFTVNPSGVKRDGFISGDAEWNEDVAWDAVWSVSTRRDSLGWTAEFRIPLSQLRFATSGGAVETAWGIQFVRDVARRGERSMWVPIPPAEGRFVSQFGTLSGVPVREAKRRLELTPYTVASASQSNTDPGNPLRHASEETAALGADFKVGLTSDLTLTGTVNPDFGQVEADPSQVNLTGAETFFAERRPFFTEGSHLFQYNMTWGDWLFASEQLFYSRRIGRTPQLDYPDSANFTSERAPTRLLAAGKLSGQTRGWSIGMLSATTARETGRYTHAGGIGRSVIEPLTHYGMARLGRDFAEGRSAIGLIGTATNRQLDDAAIDVLHASAYAGGIEGRHRFGGDNVAIAGYLFGSRVAGSSAALARTQTSFRHLYQRDPDAMGLDSAATSMEGYASEIRLTKQGGGRTRAGLTAHVVSRGFDVNDMGFLTATNFASTTGWVGRERNQQTRHTRLWASYVNWWGQRTLTGDGSILGFNWWNHVVLRNYWDIAGLVERREAVSATLLRGGPEFRIAERYLANIRLSTDPRPRVSWLLNVMASPSNKDGSRLLTLGPGTIMRPTARAELQVQPFLTWERNGTQFIDHPLTPSGRRYIVGDLKQRTASITARGSYAFTPELTLQAYAQPFVSTGRFVRVGEVVQPRARQLDQRVRFFDQGSVSTSTDRETVTYATSGGAVTLDNPDFSVTNLNANVVLRWEYRAGSTLYAVWNQGRSGEAHDSGASFGSLSRELWRTASTNVVLIKWAHYMGR